MPRIVITRGARDADRLRVFVATGSIEEPIACAADNDGWPLLCTVYVRQGQYQGLNGAYVDVIFEHIDNDGREFAFNIEQIGAGPPPYHVYNRP